MATSGDDLVRGGREGARDPSHKPAENGAGSQPVADDLLSVDGASNGGTGTNPSVEELAGRLVESVVVQVKSRLFWQGPLPPPDTIKAYEEIVPGAADRIIRMAEAALSDRKECRLRGLDADTEIARRSQWFSFIIVMTVITGSLVLITIDRTCAGGIAAIVAALGTLVAALLGGRYLAGRGAAESKVDDHPTEQGDIALESAKERSRQS